MTERVELDRLLEVAAGFGTVPMLLTADEDGRPRAAAVSVTWEDPAPERIAMVSAGRRSLRNAADRPAVTLLWPAPPGGRFALLVDGEAAGTEPAADERDGGTVRLRVTGAILHVVDRSPGGRAARSRSRRDDGGPAAEATSP